MAIDTEDDGGRGTAGVALAPGPRLQGAVLAGVLALAFVLSARFRSLGLDFLDFLVLVAVLGAGTVAALAFRAGPGWTLSRTSWAWLLVWLGALALNVRTSISAETSFHFSLILAMPLAGFLIAVALLRTAGGPRLLAALLLGGGMLAAVAAVVEYARTGDRAAGVLTDANNLATLCYVLWFAVFARGLAGNAGGRGWYGAGFALLLVLALGVFVTQSRGGTVVLLTGAGLLSLLAIRRSAARPTIVLGGLALGAAWGVALLAAGGDELVGRFTASDAYGSGVGVRWAMLEGALSMYQAHPLTGTGLGGFRLLYPMFRPLADQTTGAFFTHNDYVQLLAEGGPLLALLAVALVGALAFTALRLAFTCAIETARPRLWVALGLAVGLLGACAHMLVNFLVFLPIGALFVGVIAGTVLVAATEETPRRPTFSGPLSAVVGGLALLPVLFYLSVDAFAYGVLQDQTGFPGAARFREPPERQYRTCVRLTGLNPDRGLPWLCRALHASRFADQLGGDGFRREAERSFAEALRRDAYNPRVFVEYARWQEQQADADPQELEQLYLRALTLDPVRPAAVNGLLDLYVRTGRMDSAAGLLTNVLWPRMELAWRRHPRVAAGWLDQLEALARARDDGTLIGRVRAQRDRLEGLQLAPDRERAF